MLRDYCDVCVISGRYSRKKRKMKCSDSNCGQTSVLRTHEEKETDVALGVNVISDLHLEKPDKIIILSNDTDFKPVILNILEKSNLNILLLSPLGVDSKNRFNFSKIEKKYPDRIEKKQIKPLHMQKSVMDDIIKINNKEYKNPYPFVKN